MKAYKKWKSPLQFKNPQTIRLLKFDSFILNIRCLPRDYEYTPISNQSDLASFADNRRILGLNFLKADTV